MNNFCYKIKNKFKNIVNFKNQEKGISLLFVIIIMSVVLAIGTGLSTIFIQQGQMMTEIGYSVVAFYAADAGIESALIMDPLASTTEGSFTPDVEAGYKVFIRCGSEFINCPAGLVIDSTCDSPNYCIKSIGSYKTVKRAIEIGY